MPEGHLIHHYAATQRLGLLDQRLVSGIGNVIRAEALHAARLHPRRPADSLTVEVLDALGPRRPDHARRGRTGTYRHRTPPGRWERNVYKQQTCGTCGRPVEAFDLAGRTAYACPFDQPDAVR